MNQAMTLQPLIEGDFDVILTKDCNGINAGSVIWRNSPWTHAFLQDIYNTHNDSSINAIEHWWEQAGIIHLLQTNPADKMHIRFVPARSLNAWPLAGVTCQHQVYQPGDFVIHFPGETREELVHFISEHEIPT